MRAYYAVFIHEADGRYSILFPDVAGCQTWGHTIEEGFERAIEALDGHLEVLASDGDDIPAPSDRGGARRRMLELAAELGIELPEDTEFLLIPAPDLETSVKVTVSFKRGTLEMIDRKAEAAGMTRSGFIANATRVYEISQQG